MKRLALLAMLLVIPLFCGAHCEHHYKKNYRHAFHCWNRANELISELHHLDPNQTDLFLSRITEAAELCNQAASFCDKVCREARHESYGLFDATFGLNEKKELVHNIKHEAQKARESFIMQRDSL